MLKKVILTGATGFLGKALLEKFIENGFLVYVLVRKSSNVNNILGLILLKQIVYYETLSDVNLIKDLENVFDADLFIHCAWKGVSNSERDKSDQITYNLSLTMDSVKLANKIKCKKWVGIGSQAEYGLVNKISKEDKTPIKPFTAYGKAKVASYWAAEGLCEIFGIKMLWCRIFSLYGPSDNPQYLIPYVIQSLLRDNSPSLTLCQQKWDYLYLTDGVDAIFKLAKSESVGVFNIGSGKTTTLKYIVDCIQKQINPKLKIGYGEKEYSKYQIMHLQADIQKINENILWKPITSIEKGLLETIHFYQSNF